MTDRAELIEAGAQALYPMTGRTDPRHVGDYEHTTAAGVVDAVEPLIRADERERAETEDPVLAHYRLRWEADLRARVEALRLKHRTRDWDYHEALDDVQALLGGSDD